MPASLTNIKLAPNLVLECQLYIHKPSIRSSIRSQQADEHPVFESVISSTETKSHTSIIRLLTKTHNIRVSELQTKVIINTFKDSIIEIFKILDLDKLQDLNEVRSKAKSIKATDQFVKTFEKGGYKIRVFTKFVTFMKIIDEFLINDYMLIRMPKESGVEEPVILIEEDEPQGIPVEGEEIREDEAEDKKPTQRFEYRKLKLLKSLKIQVLKVPTR